MKDFSQDDFKAEIWTGDLPSVQQER
jgi:hypothetical protein